MAKTLANLQTQFYDGSTKYVSMDNRYTFWPEGDLDARGNATSHDHQHVTLHDDSFSGPGGALSRFHITYYHNGQGGMPVHVYFAVHDGIVSIPDGADRASAVDANRCQGHRQNAIQHATGNGWPALANLAVVFVQRAFGESSRQRRRAQQVGADEAW